MIALSITHCLTLSAAILLGYFAGYVVGRIDGWRGRAGWWAKIEQR